MTALTEGPAHARLSPSSAYRWMACPASANLALTVPDVPTIYAAEGTMLHEVAAKAIEAYLQGYDFTVPVGEEYSIDGFDFVFTDDHATLVEWCVDKVRMLVEETNTGTRNLTGFVEMRLPMSFIEDGAFGTADLIVHDRDTRTLYVYDHKFGGGVKVYAAGNPQLIAYALAAIDYIVWGPYEGRVDRIVFGVLQPRLNHYDVEEMTIAQANDWREKFTAAAKATHDIGAPLRAGDHCKFCPVKPTCPELHTTALAAAQAVYSDPVPDPYTLDADRIADVLAKAPLIRTYLEAVEQEARRRLQVGLPVTGWKIVQGRGTRSWQSPSAIRQWAEGLAELGAIPSVDVFYDVPSFLSVAQFEKKCKALGVVFPAAFVHKEFGAPAVVPDSDPRPSLAVALEAIPEDGDTR